MPVETKVWLYGQEVGTLTNAGGTVTFAYSNSYTGIDISASIPRDLPYRRGNVYTYLEGLLPDNDRVISRWARDFQISPNQRLELLRHIGLDLPGAIQISDDKPSQSGELIYLSDREVEERLNALAHDDAEWSAPYAQEGRFSLGGASKKTALYRGPDGQWADPRGRFPSTHILKPAMSFDSSSDTVEFLTMKIAQQAGLDVAHVDLQEIGNTRVVIVERYDRVSTAQGVERIHQEDLCQALGVHPDKKYESQGGPSAVQCLQLLKGLGPEQSKKFIEGLAFNVAIWGSDAHARNYSILYPEGQQPRLAPLYDLISAYPYHRPVLNPDKHVRSALDVSAMSIGGERRFRAISDDNWAKLAKASGIDTDLVIDTVRTIQSRIPDAVSDTLARYPDLGRTSRKLSSIPLPHAGEIWVSPHTRRGSPVAGHWRKRPQ